MKWKEKFRVKIIKLILGSDFFQKNNLKKTQKHKNVFFGENLDFGEKSDFFINGDIVKLYIGNKVNCKRFCSFLLFPNASLIIYDGVFFNNNCSVNCLGSIEIGENTIFGENVKMYDHNHEYSFGHDNVVKVEKNRFKIGFIKIGKNCWIGSNVTILSNVEIGDNVIIGANCLVHNLFRQTVL